MAKVWKKVGGVYVEVTEIAGSPGADGADGADGATGATGAAGTNAFPIPRGTSLPGSPADGDEYTLVDSLTAPTYAFRFRYANGSTTGYKWEAVGGFPWRKHLTGGQIVATNNTWQILAAMSFTAPKAGIYEVTLTGVLGVTTGTCYGGAGINGTIQDGVLQAGAGTFGETAVVVVTVTAGQTIDFMSYMTDKTTMAIYNPTLFVKPIMVA